jgi:NADH-quinone oxidoreductase subunit N
MLTAFTHMVTLFVGLETMGISLYILAGSDKRSLLSGESALKYLLLGAFATGITLFGMAMLYGATGSLDFATISQAGAGQVDSFLFQAGVFFLLTGILFKVAAAPFHFWSPDVYEGAPSQVMLFMSVVVKIASFAALFRLFGQYLQGYTSLWWEMVYYACIASLLVGNLMALVQKTLKRQLAYSSISHTGYLLFALLVVQGQDLSDSIFFYLLTYGLATLVAFSVLFSWFSGKVNPAIDDLKGAAKADVPGSLMVTLAFLSMAGIPPAGGFFAKLFLFTPAMSDGLIHLLIIGIVSSVVGAAYYLRPVMNLWFSPSEPVVENPGTIKWMAMAGGVLILATGLFPDAIRGLLSMI